MQRLVLVVGQAQTGKTTLALKKLIRPSVPRLLILDPVRSKPFTDLTRKGAHQFARWEPLSNFLGSANGNWVALLRSTEAGDYAKALENARFMRHVTILADEALALNSDPATREHMTKTARANAHFGDGIGVPLWITAQRPMDLEPNVRSQATGFISFRQEEPADLDFLSKRCTPEFAEKVSALQGHDWLAYPDNLFNGE